MKGSNNKDRNRRQRYNGKAAQGKTFNKKESSDSIKDQKFNDASWYVANGQLLKDFASLSFNNALGAKSVVRFNPYDGEYEAADYTYTAPGIMSIYTAPAFGISTDGSSALNLAAKNFYTWIRHQNSGHANYDSPDLMLYFGALDSIYSLLSSMIRAYGTMRAFSQINRYVGDALLRAQGYNPQDLRANMSDFRGYINMVITKVSAFCAPVTMAMFKRHFWMYSGVYRDEDVVKSQAYMYVPGTLWKYNELEGAGRLDPVLAFCSMGSTLYSSNKTFAQVRGLMDDLLGALVASEDINIMSGDILKAYGKENLWTLSMIPEDYVVFPVYSEEVLDQIHNTTFAGVIPVATLDLTTDPTLSLDRLGVIQDPEVGDGSLYFAPQFKNCANLSYDAVVDMHKEDPTPEDVIVSTRNILVGKTNSITDSSNSITTLTGCGSDICFYAIVWTMNSLGNGLDATNIFTNQNGYSTGILTKLSTFNKYPRMLTLDQATKTVGIMGELDNYTVVSHDDIQRMHDTAVLSLLGVPFLGTGSKT